jgi:hypothetical protein
MYDKWRPITFCEYQETITLLKGGILRDCTNVARFALWRKQVHGLKKRRKKSIIIIIIIIININNNNRIG